MSDRPMTDVDRDRLAEEWLMKRHHRDWYMGEGTEAEWREAYAAVDAEIARAIEDFRTRPVPLSEP